MSVTFIGDCDFKPVSDPAFPVGGIYDLPSCKQDWRGKAPAKQAFVDKLKRGQPLAGNPRMFLSSIEDDRGLVFPTVGLNYIGVSLKGTPPPPQITTSFALKNAQVDGSTVGGGGSGATGTGGGFSTILGFSFSYLAPRTKYDWYEFTGPQKAPRYNSATGGDPADTLFNIRMSDRSTVLADVLRKQLVKVKRAATIADYVVEELVPGAIWKCSSTIDLDFAL